MKSSTQTKLGEFLAIGFCLAALPWLFLAFARLSQVDALIFLCIPLIAIEYIAIPVLAFIELGWIAYFLYDGGTFIDLEKRRARGREYRKLIPHAAAIALFALTFALANSATVQDWSFRRDRLTTDADLIRNYQQHKLEFQMLQKLSQDPATANSREAKTLATKLQLRGGIHGNMFYSYSVRSGLFGTYDKGYFYSRETPASVNDSLDSIQTMKECQDRLCYRKIDDDWYLFIFDI